MACSPCSPLTWGGICGGKRRSQAGDWSHWGSTGRQVPCTTPRDDVTETRQIVGLDQTTSRLATLQMYLQTISKEEQYLLDHLPKDKPVTVLRGVDRCTQCIRINRNDLVLGRTMRNCSVILDQSWVLMTACYCCRIGHESGCDFARRGA